jgi:hypothetical protein
MVGFVNLSAIILRRLVAPTVILLLISPMAEAQSDRPLAGVSASVNGEVMLLEPETSGEGLRLAGGEDIFLADQVNSGKNSGMQILLVDESTFTVGPETQLVIDEFVFDPDTNIGSTTASAAAGIFRFVSGKVAQNNPGAVNVELPSGTMGVRGTMVLVVFGEPEGTLIINLGPGSGKDASEDKLGLIEFDSGTNFLVLDQTGFAMAISPNGEITGPFPIEIERLAALLARLSAGSGNSQAAILDTDSLAAPIDLAAFSGIDPVSGNFLRRALQEAQAQEQAAAALFALASEEFSVTSTLNTAFSTLPAGAIGAAGGGGLKCGLRGRCVGRQP